ncbi:hypothetical protein U1Q18_007761, partial [Sarracenia purpurea var. burkii]
GEETAMGGSTSAQELEGQERRQHRPRPVQIFHNNIPVLRRAPPRVLPQQLAGTTADV